LLLMTGQYQHEQNWCIWWLALVSNQNNGIDYMYKHTNCHACNNILMINASWKLTLHKLRTGFLNSHKHCICIICLIYLLNKQHGVWHKYKGPKPEFTRGPHFCHFICYAVFRAATFPKKLSFRFLDKLIQLRLLTLFFHSFFETWKRETKADDTNILISHHLVIDH
jgi:hypothetical protein